MRRIQRRAQPSVTEHLRRKRPPQCRTLDGFPDDRTGAGGAARALEGIRCRRREQPADGVRPNLRQQPLKILRREAGPCGIVHEHPVVSRGAACKGAKGVAHRLAALRAPGYGREARGVLRAQALRHFRKSAIVRRERHDHVRAARIGQKRRQRPLQNSAPGERCILLGQVATEAGT